MNDALEIITAPIRQKKRGLKSRRFTKVSTFAKSKPHSIICGAENLFDVHNWVESNYRSRILSVDGKEMCSVCSLTVLRTKAQLAIDNDLQFCFIIEW